MQIGVDPAAGIIVMLPPHAGPVTLTFDLHNRHTYSEEQVKQKKAYSRYTATIGVLTMNNDLISRAVVLNEFRSEGRPRGPHHRRERSARPQGGCARRGGNRCRSRSPRPTRA